MRQTVDLNEFGHWRERKSRLHERFPEISSADPGIAHLRLREEIVSQTVYCQRQHYEHGSNPLPVQSDSQPQQAQFQLEEPIFRQAMAPTQLPQLQPLRRGLRSHPLPEQSGREESAAHRPLFHRTVPGLQHECQRKLAARPQRLVLPLTHPESCRHKTAQVLWRH